MRIVACDLESAEQQERITEECTARCRPFSEDVALAGTRVSAATVDLISRKVQILVDGVVTELLALHAGFQRHYN